MGLLHTGSQDSSHDVLQLKRSGARIPSQPSAYPFGACNKTYSPGKPAQFSTFLDGRTEMSCIVDTRLQPLTTVNHSQCYVNIASINPESRPHEVRARNPMK